jgi:hypothetical protein
LPLLYILNGRRMSVRLECAELLQYFNPFSANLEPSPPQDEDVPAAKRPRLQASTSVSNAEDSDTADTHTAIDAADTYTETTASPDDTVAVVPTDAVTVVATSLPSDGGSHAWFPYQKWSPEEDAKLTEAVTEFVNDWVRVATLVPGRTNKQCRQRWTAVVDPTWTPEEDAKLTKAVKEFGNDWVRVAAMVPGRRHQQCRQRWTAMILDPTIDRKTHVADTYADTVTTASPDDTVGVAPTDAVTVVATSLPSAGASHACLPYQRWSPEEDAKLTEAAAEFGNDWVRVARLVPGRRNKQCRQRWNMILDPTIDRKTAHKEGKRLRAEVTRDAMDIGRRRKVD